MELVIILVLTIIYLIIFPIIALNVENEELAAKSLTCSSVLYPFLVIFLLISYMEKNMEKPTAIDVYEGKTTLEITYKDKVPIDSTVVWKNK